MHDFSDLCRMYHERLIRNHEYAIQAAQFIGGLAHEVAKKIGAPETFTRHDENKQVRYVRALTPNPETDSLEPAGIFLHWDDKNGVWEAGVGIHLEPAKNAYPKTEFATQFRFRLQEGHIDLAIPPNDHFQMTVDDRSSWQPVIERIIERLALMLSLQPWERYEEPPEEHQQTIGFLRF